MRKIYARYHIFLSLMPLSSLSCFCYESTIDEPQFILGLPSLIFGKRDKKRSKRGFWSLDADITFIFLKLLSLRKMPRDERNNHLNLSLVHQS